MPTPPLSRQLAEEAVAAVEVELAMGGRPPGQTGEGHGAIERAAAKIGDGINHKTLRNRLEVARQRYGLEPNWALNPGAEPESTPHRAKISGILKKGPQSLLSVASAVGLTKGQALDILDELRSRGAATELPSGLWSVGGAGEAAYLKGASLRYESDDVGRYKFGVVSDNHLASKYERRDVLDDLYTWFEQEGITKVFNGGNFIEGEASFNKNDILFSGLDAQVRYLAQSYPKRPGIITYAVTGDDHEGWYAQREGINIGQYVEAEMRRQGRNDWTDMGYMEAHIALTHKKSGKSAIMALCHAGGGATYALSYAPQKIIESLEGGEKPAVAVFGHYHKLWAGNIRNVWVLLPGCTKDQDPFMRKRRIEAHIGGTIVELRQDEASGAIHDFLPWMRRYFNKGFYAGRWSHSGPVALPVRTL